MAQLTLLTVLPSLAVAWLLTAAWLRLGPGLGLVDRPSPRKSHARPTPTAGGVAVVAAVLGALALAALCPPAALSWNDLAWLVPAAAVAALGFIDDVRPLPWPPRLAMHFVGAAAGVWLTLPELDGLMFGAAILWVAAMINAFNMLDNMDALCGGTGWIAATALATAGLLQAQTALAAPALALVGALAGFLWFNRPPARVFLGDVGSTFIGCALGLLSLRTGLAPEAPAWGWLIPPALLAVPCYDMTTVILLRLRQGRNPFHADTQHLSHRLVQRGRSRAEAVGIILVLALVSGTAGLLLVLMSSGTAAAAVAVGLAGCWAAVAVWERRAPTPAAEQGPGVEVRS